MSGKRSWFSGAVWCIAAMAVGLPVAAYDYEVGPLTGMIPSISEVPWESLAPGDRVLIHWKSTPYNEKWVICRQGTAEQPIVVSGVPGPAGQLPVIDGQNATTRAALDFWNESRGAIKIGGASVPSDTLPSYIVISNLEIRSARPPYTFTDDNGSTQSYSSNAAAIYVEKAEHLVIRDCILRDSGNGLFIGAFNGDTQDILIEGNWIYDNGIEGSYYEHNTYTSAIGITYQLNYMGGLRAGCDGNNLKDRSAGLVVRYNWIEDGNRQLDLVDATGIAAVNGHPDYRTTFVYGNVLTESDGEGNSQILHYGGDSSSPGDYRKGTLYFFNNTVVSTRSGNTTLMRLSTNDEGADVRNNLIYTTAPGTYLALLSTEGRLDLHTSWLPTGWRTSHSTFTGVLTDHLTSIEGTDPGLVDLAGRDLSPAGDSPCVNAAGPLHPDAVANHQVELQYVRDRRKSVRLAPNGLDIGAFEHGLLFADGLESEDLGAWSAAAP